MFALFHCFLHLFSYYYQKNIFNPFFLCNYFFWENINCSILFYTDIKWDYTDGQKLREFLFHLRAKFYPQNNDNGGLF